MDASITPARARMADATVASRFLPWILCLFLAGCGGGGGGDDSPPPPPPPASPTIGNFASDQQAYFVGDVARLTAVFSNGTGMLQPGNIAITSGQAVSTPVLSEDTTYRLVVSNGATSVSRELALDVNYRGRMRTLNMPFARSEHVSVALPDGRILILGGDDAGVTLPEEVYQFVPATESFTKLTDMSSGRDGCVAVTLANGDVLVALGGRVLTQAPVAEVIDTTTGAVTPTANEPSRPRMYATATLLADGRVLIAGGANGVGADPSAEIYEPSTRTFTRLTATMAKGRYGHTATRLNDGRVFLFGGYTNGLQPAPPEVFEPATSTFTTLPMPESFLRANHAAVKSGDGRVWIMGGVDAAEEPMRSTLRFDPETLFSLGPDLGVPRSYFGGALLTDGRVLTVGGAPTSTFDNLSATSDLIASPLNRTGGPDMSTVRVLHTVNVLPNGKVLIVGGMNNTTQPLTTAEIFE